MRASETAAMLKFTTPPFVAVSTASRLTALR